MVLNISNHDDLHMYTRQEVNDICACFVGLLQAIKSVILSTFIVHTTTVKDSITATTCCKMLPVLPGQTRLTRWACYFWYTNIRCDRINWYTTLDHIQCHICLHYDTLTSILTRRMHNCKRNIYRWKWHFLKNLNVYVYLKI